VNISINFSGLRKFSTRSLSIEHNHFDRHPSDLCDVLYLRRTAAGVLPVQEGATFEKSATSQRLRNGID